MSMKIDLAVTHIRKQQKNNNKKMYRWVFMVGHAKKIHSAWTQSHKLNQDFVDIIIQMEMGQNRQGYSDDIS